MDCWTVVLVSLFCVYYLTCRAIPMFRYLRVPIAKLISEK